MQLPQANLNSMVSKYHMTLKGHTQEIPGAQSSTLGQAPKDGPKWSLLSPMAAILWMPGTVKL